MNAYQLVDFILFSFIFFNTGTIIGGTLIDWFTGHVFIVMAIFLLTMGLSNIALPFCDNMYSGTVLLFLYHFTYNIASIVGSVYVIALWGESASTPIYVLYLGHPIGCVIAPMLTRPFLSDNTLEHQHLEDNISLNCNSTSNHRISSANCNSTLILTNQIKSTNYNLTNSNLQSGITSPTFEATLHQNQPTESRIEVPYMIEGVLLLVTALVFGILHTKKGSLHSFTRSKKQANLLDTVNPKMYSHGRPAFGIAIAIIVFIYYTINQVIDATIPKYFFTYATKSRFQYSHDKAAFFDATCNSSYLIGLIFSTIVSHFVSIEIMQSINVTGITLATFVMMQWGVKYEHILWISSCIFYFIVAALWPGGYAWANRYILLNNTLLSISDIFLQISAGAFSWIGGYILDSDQPDDLITLLFVLCVLLTITVLIGQFIGCIYGQRFEKEDDIEMQHMLKEEENSSA